MVGNTGFEPEEHSATTTTEDGHPGESQSENPAVSDTAPTPLRHAHAPETPAACCTDVARPAPALPPDLAALAELWPALTEADRAAVLALARERVGR